MRHLIALGKRPGTAVSLDFNMIDIAEGFAAVQGIPGEHAYNPMGSVHGGYAATLLIPPAAAPSIRNLLHRNLLQATATLRLNSRSPLTRP